MYLSGSPFWSSAGSMSGLGYAFALGTFIKFAHTAKVNITPGLQLRFDMPGTTEMLGAAWAWVRFQFGPIYVGGGAAPLVWNFGTSGTGAGSFNPLSTSTMGFGAEVGGLYQFTPEFALGVVLTGATYLNYSTTVMSPLLGANATVVMRFYYLFWQPSKSEKESQKYKDWRYPDGWMR